MVLPQAVLAARVLAAESQLAVFQERLESQGVRRHRFSESFRWLWILLSGGWEDWARYAQLMQPATVKRWHEQGFRLFWRWKSHRRGRPAIAPQLRALIRQMSQENRLWGAERIRDTIGLLGFPKLDVETVRKYMVGGRTYRQRSSTWLSFLRNHLQVSWAIDFFTVTTVGFGRLYVFVVLEHGRRRVIHWATTAHPTLAWVLQQLREATPFGRQPRFLFRDNDRIYGQGVAGFLKSCQMEEVRTAFRCPWQNPFVERFGGSLRREVLDHVIVLNESHLERLLKEYIEEFYHLHRPHQGLGGQTPEPSPRSLQPPSSVIAIPVLGGLHHHYVPVAA
jgi:transposase InsO family protein